MEKYINNRTKIKCKCLLDNYEWSSTPNSLLSGRGCPECKRNKISYYNTKTHDVFKSQAEKINPNIEIYSKYINGKTKIKCKCKIDGYIWEILPSSVLDGCKCPKCVKDSNIDNDKFIKLLFNKNNNVTLSTIITDMHQKIICSCNLCNHKWETTPYALLHGHGCPKCDAKNKKRKTHEKFISDLNDINKNIEILEKYINNRTKIKCQCKLCKNIWYAIPCNLLNGSGCPICNKSYGENRIKDFLLKNDILYLSQYRFEDLRGINNGMLSYDFYLPNHNMLIEFQGKQHNIPIDFFGGDDQFKIQQEHDKRKRDYAKRHNIILLEIWYYDINNIEKILESKLIRKSA